MPREMVQSAAGLDPAFVVKVGWERGTDVQVGVENDEYRSILWLLYGGSKALDAETQAEALEALGTTLVAAVNERVEGMKPVQLMGADTIEFARSVLDAFDSMNVYSGVWADLDRHGCNELIRIVRRARDQAFGRDE